MAATVAESEGGEEMSPAVITLQPIQNVTPPLLKLIEVAENPGVVSVNELSETAE